MDYLAEDSPASYILRGKRELSSLIANNNELMKESVVINEKYNDVIANGNILNKGFANGIDEISAALKKERADFAALQDAEASMKESFDSFLIDTSFTAMNDLFTLMGESMAGSATAGDDMTDTLRDLGQEILNELPRLMFYAGVQLIKYSPEVGIALIIGSGLVAIGSGIYSASMASGSAEPAQLPSNSVSGGGVRVSIINQSGVSLQGEVEERQGANGSRELQLTMTRLVASSIASGGTDQALRNRPNGRALALRRA
jgi:hypothetical protein